MISPIIDIKHLVSLNRSVHFQLITPHIAPHVGLEIVLVTMPRKTAECSDGPHELLEHFATRLHHLAEHLVECIAHRHATQTRAAEDHGPCGIALSPREAEAEEEPSDDREQEGEEDDKQKCDEHEGQQDDVDDPSQAVPASTTLHNRLPKYSYFYLL
jgi:hypothetical protein